MKSFLLLIVLIITDQMNAFVTDQRRLIDDDSIAEDNVDQNRFFWLADPIVPLALERRSESAERYFDWASKTQRPVEYFRGKRFWLFTKKDDQSLNPESGSTYNPSSNTMGQGIWRSGIVGRR